MRFDEAGLAPARDGLGVFGARGFLFADLSDDQTLADAQRHRVHRRAFRQGQQVVAFLPGRSGIAKSLFDADLGDQAVDLQVDRGVETGHVGAAAVGTGDAQRAAVGQRRLPGEDRSKQGQE